MFSKTVTNPTLKLIDRYMKFRLEENLPKSSLSDSSKDDEQTTEPSTPINIPYFNNRRRAMAIGLRGAVGKGTPEEIAEEVDLHAQKKHLPIGALINSLDVNSGVSALKKFMVDHSIGIDCSGLVYHLVNSEQIDRKGKSLSKSLDFPIINKGILNILHIDRLIMKIKSYMRPAENASVKVFAHSNNSKVININEVIPGDIVTILNAQTNRDHILFIHRVDYNSSGSGEEGAVPSIIHYTHAIAWPSDGKYNHGVRQGTIQIKNITTPISEQFFEEPSQNERITSNWLSVQKDLANLIELRRLLF